MRRRAAGGLTLILAFSPQGRRDLKGDRDARFPSARERRGLGGTAGGRGDGLHALLKQYFGYDDFRPRQEEIIANALAGQHGMVIMPTGGGKSLCYQLPALAVNGLTLVVSPLIALMKDQVDGLQANGIAAGFINSSLNAGAISRVQQMAEDGALRVLYVAPERIGMPAFQRFLAGAGREPHRDRRGALHQRMGP